MQLRSNKLTVGIYGIFDSITDECLYVGLSKTIEDRWKAHIRALQNGRHRQSQFTNWFREKNNEIDSLSFRILEECESSDKVLNQLEFNWTKILYPKFAGKIPSENEKWTHTEDTKKRIAAGVSIARKANNTASARGEICCENCSEKFRGHLKFSKFCSKSCANNSYRRLNLETDEKIKLLYLDGYSLRQVANEFEISHISIRKRLSQMGVPLRGRNPSARK